MDQQPMPSLEIMKQAMEAAKQAMEAAGRFQTPKDEVYAFIYALIIREVSRLDARGITLNWVMSAVKNKGDLDRIWVFMEPYWTASFEAIWTEISEIVHREQRVAERQEKKKAKAKPPNGSGNGSAPSTGDQVPGETQSPFETGAGHGDTEAQDVEQTAAVGAGDQRYSETQKSVEPGTDRPDPNGASEEAQRRLAIERAAREMCEIAYLETIKIRNKPIGEWKVAALDRYTEGRAPAIRSWTKEYRMIRHVLTGLDDHHKSLLVKECRTDAEIGEALARATTEVDILLAA